MGSGEFIVLVDGRLDRFSHWDGIPAVVDAIVKFLPDIPPGPHTAEQHDAIELLPKIFAEFMKRERGHACRDKNR